MALVLVPALALFLWTAWGDWEHATQHVHENANRVVRAAIERHHRQLGEARTVLRALARAPEVIALDGARCSALVSDLTRRSTQYTNLVVAKPDGTVVCSAVPLAGPVNFSDRRYFRHALSRRELAVGEFVVGRVTGKPLLAVAGPVVDASGTVRAVVVTGLDLGWLEHALAESGMPQGASICVIDSTGVVLARYPDGESVSRSIADTPLFNAMQVGQGTRMLKGPNLDGSPWFYAFAALGVDTDHQPVYLGVGIPYKAAFAEVGHSRLWDLMWLGAATALTLVVAVVMSRRLVVSDVERERRVAAAQLHRRLEDLEALHRMVQALSRAEALQEIYAEVVRALLGAVGADHGAVLILGDGVMRLQASSGLSEDCRRAVEHYVPWPAGTEDPRPILFPGVAEAAEPDTLRDVMLAEGIRALGFIPLTHHRRLIGELVVSYDAPHGFAGGEIALLEALAGHVGVAVERQRDADAVRMSDARFRALAESATDAIITMGADGRITLFNSAAERMFGHPAESVIGQSAEILMPEEYRDRHGRALRRYLATGETAIQGRTVEVVGKRRSGHVFPIEVSVSVVRVGDEVTFAAIIRDVSERKRAEERLREQEARYRTLFEQSPDGVVLIDPETTRLLDFNAAAHRQLGYSAEEFAQFRLADFQAAETPDEITAHVTTALREGRGEFETRHRTRTGEVRDVHVSSRTVVLGGRPVLHCVFRDVTERKRAEEAFRQSEKLATLGELLAGVAHELNNPLAVVMGHATLLQNSTRGSAFAERAEKIRAAGERCARIVRNFLDLARKRAPQQGEVRLHEIVRETAELLAYQLRLDGVEVDLDIPRDLPVLWADRHQLGQVLVNLMTNAQHAMHAAPGPRRLGVSARFDTASNRVRLEVADTGPGIPPEIQPRIFEPFFTTKPPGEGTGLGLPLCRGIVENHGGTITVESQPGRGAIFRIELPVGAPPEARSALGPVDARAPAIRGTILVVDDEQPMAELLADILSAAGHEVVTVSSGAAALSALSVRRFDLILSDVKMPEMGGVQFYRELEARHPDLCRRVVFVTGDTLTGEIQDFLASTRLPTIDKPFDVTALRRAVQDVLRAGTAGPDAG